jgi:hypothetical protein
MNCDRTFKLSDARLLMFAHGSHCLGLSQTSSDQEETDDARGTNSNTKCCCNDILTHASNYIKHNIFSAARSLLGPLPPYTAAARSLPGPLPTRSFAICHVQDLHSRPPDRQVGRSRTVQGSATHYSPDTAQQVNICHKICSSPE